MDAQIRRKYLLDQYVAYLSAIAKSGVEISPIPDDVLNELTVTDLERIVNDMSKLARTPAGKQ